MKFIHFRFKTTLLFGVVIGVGVAAHGQFRGPLAPPQPAIAGRPGLVLRLEPNGPNTADLKVSFDYLTTPGSEPIIPGHRFYSYTVPFDGTPSRIGFSTPQDKVNSVVLHRKKYLYVTAEQDRHENGSVSIQRIAGTPENYQVRGAYSYFGELFIIDETLKANENALLYEEVEPKP